MDSKASEIKRVSHRRFKSKLPRVTDAVQATLQHLDQTGDSSMVEQFVCDAVDAFWTVPLHPDERRFFVGRVRGVYMIYLRTAQGSRGAPLSWAAVFGLIGRQVQSMFLGREACDIDVVMLEDYVDDPWSTLVGTQVQRDRHLAMLISTCRYNI